VDGGDKSVKVEVLDEEPYYKEDNLNFKFNNELAKVLDFVDFLQANSPFPVLNDKAKYLNDNGFSIFVKPKFVRQGGNKESTKSRLYYSETKHSLSVEVGMKGEKEFPVPGLAFPPLDLSYWGCDIVVKAGAFWKIGGKAAGEIGKTWTKLDYFEDNTLDSEKTTIAPAQVSLTASAAVLAKGQVNFCDYVKGTVSGEINFTAELARLKYINSEVQVTSPFLREGIRAKFEVKASAQYKDYAPYEKIIYKVDHYLKF
jgi:hypothetical protein